ncbi:transcriptional regulator [Mycolicibacterium aromaticivorans JS19b1 = JCM 16368]|uniref:Transcriptional regulator n=1 Tax=Mycolicibacterium aromaticivorans JS19b1 = JCM 16368 TaxID=1440774 RepID=A0A064CKC4_9MYCO|nr:response regulator transcription factor [Mycolicibacterium aromaticivorans]KDE99178.1 transcriptional regulator [Mycolicibacterium aromaticivorans JS19b1 = JCM 16368]
MVVGQENSRDRPDMVAARGSLVLTDGDEAIATQLIEDATAFGIQTTWCRDGAEALFAVGAESPDVLVIAARTDTVDTVDVASAVRNRSTVPILVGSAVGENDLVRAALAAGASAVISRPYDITAIAPFAFGSSSRQERKIVAAGPIRVDLRGHETRVRGRHVQLTQRELELLMYLIEREGDVASSDEISHAVWGRASDTNTVAVHVRRLREKLGHDPEHGEFIRTIRGAGYRIVPSIYT